MDETQMTSKTSQTTAERLLAIIGMNYRIIQHGDTRIADHSKAAEIIAAEIDALTADLRTANAEIARLMPLPEIYTLWKKIIEDGNPSRDTVAHFVELAHEAAERAAAAPADLRTPTDQRIAALEAQLAEALAEIDAKDKRISELEQLAALTPIKVGDISITLGLTETGEARMIFDGADDATLAVVAGKFALAMQAMMEGAK